MAVSHVLYFEEKQKVRTMSYACCTAYQTGNRNWDRVTVQCLSANLLMNEALHLFHLFFSKCC